YALKSLGVEWVLSVSAVGSLREELPPLDLVIPDQVIDRTKHRVDTFFGEGVVAHVAFAEPFCPHLSGITADAARQLVGVRTHRGGTYICIEGPQFSTRAESRIYRSWGVDVIGMTNLQEAKLCREAEICYATLALVTDYDVWHETEQDVSVEAVVAILKQNAETAKAIIKATVSSFPTDREGCSCGSAMRDAVITAHDAIPTDVRERLRPIIGKYVKQ
ncbi:MAG: S-methyl-5'-thioadenosine phosphorylase, partial [candidate division NC10 bacterium]|nr:S-methyl-5'-thioadenosine phosphorylase [candidate division NC10 bacterium]